MDRTDIMIVCALAAAASACAEDLRCNNGAVEINGVCECPQGTAYIRANGTCESGAAPGSPEAPDGASVPAGGGGRDASVPAPPPVASLPPDDPEGVPPGVPDAAACSDAWQRCGSTCVDTRKDRNHCGSCGNVCRPGADCREGVCTDVGCSDGTREAFVDVRRFPTIAGCAATWPASSMRAARKLGTCGNSVGGCRAPVDACAAGWHVCGNTDTGPADLTSRITQMDCSAQVGRFAAALGDHSCTDCGEKSSGSVCCGNQCVQQNGDCLWIDATMWFGMRDGFFNGCKETENPIVAADIGVMCCRDGN